MRVGIGYDVHRFSEGRKLILGGIEVPHNEGLLGHSDADVLVHAIMDALLGAASLGDIGKHFPDNDERYKGISSILLLDRVVSLIREKGWKCNNVDCIIIAQAPRLADYISLMEERIAEHLKVKTGQVNIKATTTEGLGFAGRREGIAAQAICSLTEIL